ncbi:MAG: nitrile hydratase subunit beta [Rhizobiaceae bacterium]
MDGPQDLGGQMGFGLVAPEADEPYFHAEWEKRALGLTLAAGAMGHWNIDESRHARERLHPADYYASSYYEIWIKALETLLDLHGFVTRGELEKGQAAGRGTKPKRVLKAGDVPIVLARGGPCDRPVKTGPRFKPGDRVRTLNGHPAGHTRLPRYARDKIGRIEAAHGGYVFPDSNAHGAGEAPQHVYTVVFDGRTLWGADCDPGLTVSIDASESYLEPVAA